MSLILVENLPFLLALLSDNKCVSLTELKSVKNDTWKSQKEHRLNLILQGPTRHGGSDQLNLTMFWRWYSDLFALHEPRALAIW